MHLEKRKIYQKGHENDVRPHLFHGPLDNEPLTACLKASGAPPILNKAEGLRKVDDARKKSLTCRTTHYQEAFAA